MIFRYSVKCPDCEAKIVLRMSVGNDEEQPFYFVCNKCGSATRGKQIIWYEPFPGARIELDEGIVLEQEPEEPDQVISIHPDLPTLKNVESMMEVGGSPFLFNISLLGDRDMEFMGRLRNFRECIDKDWVNVRRWLDHYTERRWEGFERTGESIFQENWESPPKIWQKHDLLHRALDVMVAPLWTSDNYPQMKRSWIETL